jgi:outer membrane protein OmpA-like peptidoglycan-associated protein
MKTRTNWLQTSTITVLLVIGTFIATISWWRACHAQQLCAENTRQQSSSTPRATATNTTPKVMQPTVIPRPASSALTPPAPDTTKLYFLPDSVAFAVDPDVQAVVAYAKLAPTTKLTIVGFHTTASSDVDGEPLSTHRAEVVKQLLVAQGVNPDRITATGGGIDSSIQTDDPSVLGAARRVEISFVP